MASRSDDQVRAAIAKARESIPLRDLAVRIGISHYALYKFERGLAVLTSTKARIADWLDEPGEDDTAERLRRDLRRLLGRLGVRRALEVEKAVGDVLVGAFDRAGQQVPTWVRRLGSKRGGKHPTRKPTAEPR